MSKNLIVDVGLPGWLLPPKKHRGSPYTKHTWDEVLERLSGTEPLVLICKDEHMPEYQQLLRFIHAPGNEEWLAEYHEAQRVSAESYADAGGLRLMGFDEKGNEVFEDIQRSKEIAAHFKWKAGVYNRERFGNKQDSTVVNIDLTGAMEKANERVRQSVTIDVEAIDADD